jgi:hypothetical protein
MSPWSDRTKSSRSAKVLIVLYHLPQPLLLVPHEVPEPLLGLVSAVLFGEGQERPDVALVAALGHRDVLEADPRMRLAQEGVVDVALLDYVVVE